MGYLPPLDLAQQVHKRKRGHPVGDVVIFGLLELFHHARQPLIVDRARSVQFRQEDQEHVKRGVGRVNVHAAL